MARAEKKPIVNAARVVLPGTEASRRRSAVRSADRLKRSFNPDTTSRKVQEKAAKRLKWRRRLNKVEAVAGAGAVVVGGTIVFVGSAAVAPVTATAAGLVLLAHGVRRLARDSKFHINEKGSVLKKIQKANGSTSQGQAIAENFYREKLGRWYTKRRANRVARLNERALEKARVAMAAAQRGKDTAMDVYQASRTVQPTARVVEPVPAVPKQRPADSRVAVQEELGTAVALESTDAMQQQ